MTLGLFFTFLNMREQKDIYFSALLPIRKRDTVRAAVVFAVLVEMLSMVITALFCLLSARLQPGKDNAVGMDANLMLLGAGFVLYGVFNLSVSQWIQGGRGLSQGQHRHVAADACG